MKTFILLIIVTLATSCVTKSKYNMLLSEYDKLANNPEHHVETVEENEKLKASIIEHKGQLLMRQIQAESYENAHYLILESYVRIKELSSDPKVKEYEDELVEYLALLTIRTVIKIETLMGSSEDEIQDKVNDLVKYMVHKRIMFDEDYYEDKADSLKMDLENDRDLDGEVKKYLSRVND